MRTLMIAAVLSMSAGFAIAQSTVTGGDASGMTRKPGSEGATAAAGASASKSPPSATHVDAGASDAQSPSAATAPLAGAAASGTVPHSH
ncbi:hypothetical protein LJR230_004398 [Trinickia sp. LjRoot230]|uniref:hypothetical protein n=1 Tax=Trinickia sp. LjRoot230 TaxID=3342288 RepID=UPI003ED136E8